MYDPSRRPDRAVLVVDPEAILRRLIVRLLRASHRVEEASTGAELLAALRSGRRFDAILCEVHLADVDGLALLDQIAVIAPEQVERVILLSTWVEGSGLADFARVAPYRVLEKPFRVSELRAALTVVADCQDRASGIYSPGEPAPWTASRSTPPPM